MTAGTFLNFIALMAILVARAGVARSARHSAVSERLRALYGLTAALMALRLLAGFVPPASPLVMVAAAWLPFMLLRLAEEMVRRHAPRAMKYLVLGGGLLFTILAVTLGLVWDGLAISLLAAFHALSIAGTIILLLRRRSGISIAERRAAVLVSAALAIACLLAITDFRAMFPDLAVRGGPFAVLLLLLATSRLATGRGRLRNLLADVAIALAAGGLMLGLTIEPSSQAMAMPIAAATAALTALALVVERFNGLSAQSSGLVAALSGTGDSRAAILGAHPLLELGRVIPASALSDYPQAELEHLSRHRLISLAIADAQPELGAAMHDMLQRHSATHFLRLSVEPLSFLAVSADGFAQGSLDADLSLVARLLERAE